MGVTLYHAPFGKLDKAVDWFESPSDARQRVRELTADVLVDYIMPDGSVFLCIDSVVRAPPALGRNPLDAAVFAIIPDVPRDPDAPIEYPLPPA